MSDQIVLAPYDPRAWKQRRIDVMRRLEEAGDQYLRRRQQAAIERIRPALMDFVATSVARKLAPRGASAPTKADKIAEQIDMRAFSRSKGVDYFVTFGPWPERQPLLREIISATAKASKLRDYDLMSARRTAGVVLPRQIAMWFARAHTAKSLPEIGKAFGDRDHTTVLHAIRKIDYLISLGHPFALQLIRDVRTALCLDWMGDTIEPD